MATRTQHWAEFQRWCVQRKLRARPAHPWTIAAYLRLIDRRSGADEAHDALDAISREHILKTMRTPMRHAIVVRTLEMIDRRGEVRDRHAALFDEQDVLAEAAPSPPPPKATKKSADKPGRRTLSSEPRLKARRPPVKSVAKGVKKASPKRPAKHSPKRPAKD